MFGFPSSYGSICLVCATLQFHSDSFETLQMSLPNILFLTDYMAVAKTVELDVE